MDENRIPAGGTDEDGFGDNYISLIDEDGVEAEYKVVDSIDMGEDTYVALEIPPDDPVAYLNSDGSLLILKVVYEDGEEIFSVIEDEDEYDDVAEVFMSRLSDLYDFDTDDDPE